MKTDIEIYTGGGLQCNEECVFAKTCAIHRTAGDFRSEDGFSPEIRFENYCFFCDSKNQPSMYTYFGIVPVNHDALSSGSLRLSEGKVTGIYDELEFLEEIMDIEDDIDDYIYEDDVY